MPCSSSSSTRRSLRHNQSPELHLTSQNPDMQQPNNTGAIQDEGAINSLLEPEQDLSVYISTVQPPMPLSDSTISPTDDPENQQALKQSSSRYGLRPRKKSPQRASVGGRNTAAMKSNKKAAIMFTVTDCLEEAISGFVSAQVQELISSDPKSQTDSDMDSCKVDSDMEVTATSCILPAQAASSRSDTKVVNEFQTDSDMSSYNVDSDIQVTEASSKPSACDINAADTTIIAETQLNSAQEYTTVLESAELSQADYSGKHNAASFSKQADASFISEVNSAGGKLSSEFQLNSIHQDATAAGITAPSLAFTTSLTDSKMSSCKVDSDMQFIEAKTLPQPQKQNQRRAQECEIDSTNAPHVTGPEQYSHNHDTALIVNSLVMQQVSLNQSGREAIITSVPGLS
jgi:hypothetical protein